METPLLHLLRPRTPSPCAPIVASVREVPDVAQNKMSLRSRHKMTFSAPKNSIYTCFDGQNRRLISRFQSVAVARPPMIMTPNDHDHPPWDGVYCETG